MDNIIINFLQEEPDARLSCGSRWLCVYDYSSRPYFIVYSRQRYARTTVRAYEGEDMAKALQVLRGRED